MTNKEAIINLLVLKSAQIHTSARVGIDIDLETFDFAIKALERNSQGEWIVTSEDIEGIHHIKCPFCKYEKGSEFTPFIKVTFDKLPYFCENCGADMRKEVDNE